MTMSTRATTGANPPGEDLSTEDLKAKIAVELGLIFYNPEAAASHSRKAAELLVSLRERYIDADGLPDLTGKSWHYKRDVRDIYAAAPVPRDRLSSIQARIRHHVGNVIRDRYDADTVEDAGLKAESPTERERDRRQERARHYREYLARDHSEAERKAEAERLRRMSPDELAEHLEAARLAIDEMRAELEAERTRRAAGE